MAQTSAHRNGWIKTTVNAQPGKSAMSSPAVVAGGSPVAGTKVVHLMRTYGAHGGETQLARYLAAEPQGGIEETFAFVYPDPDCAALFERMRSRVVRHDLLAVPLPPRESAWGEVLTLLPQLPALQARFANLARHADVCVVHGVQAAMIAWPAAMRLRASIPFIYFHRTTKRSGTGRLGRLLYRPYAVLAGNSKSVAASLEGLSDTARIAAIENGVDWRELEARAEPAAARGGRTLIVAVGRLIPGKRQELLIAALAELAPAYPSLDLWLVGDGPGRATLGAFAARLGIADRVRFLGHREDAPRLLRAATIFCHASSWEGMSNAVLEAMALKLPSVVCDAPGVSECHVAGETGLVVDGDAKAIAAAIKSLLGDDERRIRMGEAARRRVREHYSMEANRRRFLALYAELTGGR
jgi:glycosyltransferase involved in cell wall biosynthesis